MDDQINILHPKVLLYTAGTTGLLLLLLRFYKRYVRRIRTYLDLTPGIIDSNRPLYGRVTRVGDGDNFRFFHTPGGVLLGWGWLRHVPKTTKELKDQTLSVRLCGMDAPERAHFGKPAQPFSEDALIWLRNYLLGRSVVIIPYSVDQYRRVVAKTKVWKWTGRKDVSAEMLRNGLAVVYGGGGAEYGNNERWYRKLEARAKFLNRGLWSLGKKLEKPDEYKRVYYRGEGKN